MVQQPITREIARLARDGSWRAYLALLRFVARIVVEERGNELVFNALRELRYLADGGYDDRQALRVSRDNLRDVHRELAPQLTALGYRKISEFTSDEEDKCLVVGNRLVCKAASALRFYGYDRSLLQTVPVDGRLSNVVLVAGRLYFFVEGSLFSLREGEEVCSEALTLTSVESTVLDQGIATDPHGTLVVGEYLHDLMEESGAYVYVRRAGHDRWDMIDTLARRADKHCHIAVFDPAAGLFYVTCGDSRKMLATLAVNGNGSRLDIVSDSAGKTGGYLCAAPLDGGLLCGTDYTGGTNFLVLVRGGRIRCKEVLRGRYRRCVVTSIDAASDSHLFAAWNMGHLPGSRNGLLLRSPAGTRPLCYSDDPEVTFELFSTPDGLAVRAGTPDHHLFAIYGRG